MRTPIYLRRGNKVDLPVLNAGEPGFAVDTKQLFIGAPGGNVGLWGDSTTNLRSYVRASQSAAQSIPAAAFTKIVLNTETVDQLGEFDNVTNYRFTAQAAGIYMISAAFVITVGASNSWMTAEIYVNGATTQRVGSNTGIANNSASITGTVILKLNAGDYVELYGYTTLALSTFGGATSYLHIARIA